MADARRLPDLATDDDLPDFACKLRRYVFSSQAKTAEHFTLNHTTIVRYENGTVKPPVGYLAALATLIAGELAARDRPMEDVQTTLLRDINKAVRRFYQPERNFQNAAPFWSWNDLAQAATAYLAERTPAGEAKAASPAVVPVTPPLAPEAPAAPRSRASARHNLPLQLTSFIGREKPLEEIRRRLGRGRLLTLIGPGGTGKTRLALQAAAGLGDRFPDGVWLVELTALTAGVLVPQAVGRVLDVSEEPGQPMPEMLVAALHDRQLLLVLDNCEHLADACATLAETLLRACPGLHLLATSREPLGIAGEMLLRVPPLALPTAGGRAPLADLLQYEAVRLFVDRAQAVQDDFAVTPATAAAVVAICTRLDGIPLALELAAARVGGLSVEGIAARLDDRFRLLTSGSRTAPRRQQTLRAAIDWSYDLLPPAERHLLAGLAVFAGGWTLEAAEAVTGDAQVADIDLLLRLVRKSLVGAEEQAGQTRYRLLETIRQYAYERLREMGTMAAWQGRHAAYYLALAEEAAPQLTGAQQAEWLVRLETEHDNLRAALDWAVAAGDAATAVRLAWALLRFWDARGYLSEGQRWMETALALPGAVPAPVRAPALNGVGVLAAQQGDYAGAHRFFAESLALYQALDDPQGIAGALGNLGMLASQQGDYAQARAFHEQRLALEQAAGNRWGLAVSLLNLGSIAHFQEDYAEAARLYKESLKLCLELGDQAGISAALNHLGEVALDQDDYSAAVQLYRESLALCRELGSKQGIAVCLEGLAGAIGGQGEAERAARLFGAAAALRAAIGTPLEPSYLPTYEQLQAAAQSNLPPDRWEAALAAGRALSPDQAIADVMGEGADLPGSAV